MRSQPGLIHRNRTGLRRRGVWPPSYEGFKVTQPPPPDADSADSQSGGKTQAAQGIRYFWLTGGALAIITTLITVIATTHGGSDRSPSAPAVAATSTANPAATDTTTSTVPGAPNTSASAGSSASSTGVPSLRRSGRITLNTQDLSGVDLDSLAPDWSVGDITRRGVDLYFGGVSRDLSGTRGVLSATSIGPDSFRECQASTQTNVDIEERSIRKLPLICVTTDEDRIAVVKIVSYDEQQFVFDVAVWETGGA